MTDLEKIAMRQLRSELNEVRGRIEELDGKLTVINDVNNNEKIHIGSVINPLTFIKSHFEKALKTVSAFQID